MQKEKHDAIQEAWERVKGHFKGMMTRADYNALWANMKARGLEDDTLILAVPGSRMQRLEYLAPFYDARIGALTGLHMRFVPE